METIRQQLQKPVVTGAIGAVLGLLVGLFVLGWWLVPVQWTDATPQFLRQDLKEDYLRTVIDSYSKNQNQALAQQRYESLGDDAEKVLTAVQANPETLSPADITGFTAAIQIQPAAQPVPTTAPSGGETTPAAPKKSMLPLLLGGLCIATLVILAALAYIFLVRNRRQPAEEVVTADDPNLSHRIESLGYTPTSREEPPVAQFMTTYMMGDDLYDDSFSIDSPAGEFLGECGVGISDAVGNGEPKKITAFEVWLFDKNDIQTVTKVLMSHHAFNDSTINQRLESKGEPILAEPGKRIFLETATLTLEARIVDMCYGQGAVPANSYFDRLTLELAVWPKAQA